MRSPARTGIARRKSVQLQRAAKRSIQWSSAKSRRGLMWNGASASNIILSALPIMPGMASGGAWLGVSVPQLPCDAPAPTVAWSTISTVRPAASR
jgi:hypothetical protein